MDRQLTVVAGVALLVLLAGCAGLAGTTDGETAIESGEPDRTIDVTAQGEATTEPDRATVTVAVEATAADPETVRDELATDGERVREALLEWGLDEDDVRTDRYRVRETYQSREDPDHTEYVGEHRFEIDVDDPDDVGAVIDVAVDAGADAVQRIRFGLSDDRRSELRETALEDAMENARDEAAILATQAELEVVGVYEISTANARSRPYATADAAPEAMADSAADTAIEAGDVDVVVRVNVVFEAEEG